jgi:hypothetical protein
MNLSIMQSLVLLGIADSLGANVIKLFVAIIYKFL